jgi:hypothetical protein
MFLFFLHTYLLKKKKEKEKEKEKEQEKEKKKKKKKVRLDSENYIWTKKQGDEGKNDSSTQVKQGERRKRFEVSEYLSVCRIQYM